MTPLPELQLTYQRPSRDFTPKSSLPSPLKSPAKGSQRPPPVSPDSSLKAHTAQLLFTNHVASMRPLPVLKLTYQRPSRDFTPKSSLPSPLKSPAKGSQRPPPVSPDSSLKAHAAQLLFTNQVAPMRPLPVFQLTYQRPSRDFTP